MHVHIDQRTLVVMQCNIILSNGFESHVMEKRIIETSRSDFYGIAYCMTAKPMPIVTNHI